VLSVTNSHAACEAPNSHLFGPERSRAGAAALKNYPTDDQSEQAMDESRFPLHHRIHNYSRGSLRSLAHVEMKGQQLRSVELLAYHKGSFTSEAAVQLTHQAKVVTFRHFYAKLFLVGIGPRPLDQERFASVFGDYRYAFVQSLNVDFPLSAFCFIDRSPQPAPSESRNPASVRGEFMMSATVPDSLHNYLAGAHEVALECFASGGC